jgi:hypothetical protein
LTAEVLSLAEGQRELRFPPQTRAIAASASADGTSFIGYGEPGSKSDIELVLWPEAKGCRVFDDAVGAGFPSAGGGQALGYAPSSGLVLAAGGNDPKSSAVVGALTFDVRTGEAHAVDASARYVMGEPRAFATVSEFGAKLLVAGGEDPIHDVAEEARLARASAEVYDPEARRFELELVSLREQRTRHAALMLASGETLLVGGRGAFGSALSTLEAVSPSTRSSSVGGLQPLAFGRIEPVALRLSDGRIFVASGYGSDGHPVAALEWLEPDAARSNLVVDAPLLPARYDRAFVALPGGAVLAAGGCEDRTATSAAELESCQSLCRRGCPPAQSDAWWIAADGSITAVESPGPTPRPFLLPGSDGSPWLLTAQRSSDGSLDPSRAQAFRFNPFRARFEAVTDDLGELPGTLLEPPLVVAPDHFFWLSPDQAPAFVGLRAGTRERYARDVALVSSRHGLDPSWPLHLAPDRDPAGRLSYDGQLHFADESHITVFVTEALYEDVHVQMDVDGPPPWIVIGQTTLGDEHCPWPDGVSARETLSVRRVGATALLTRGSAAQSCALPAGAEPIGVASPGVATTLIELELERL